MVFHRNQAQFERARWRKAFILPVWALQTAMLLSLMGIFSYRLAETIEHFQEDDKKGKKPVVELVWECTNIGLSVTSLILTILEVSRLFSETLTPFFLLASHCIKTTSSFAILGLDIVVYTERSEGNWSVVGLAIDAGLLLFMLILGIYSIVKFRYVHDDDDMHHPANVKPFGFGNGYRQIEIDNVTGGDAFLRANPYNDVATEYPSQGGGVIGGSTRDRSLSAASSLRRSLSRGQPSSLGSSTREAVVPEDGRRASYNHERDTQFDAYVSRASPALSHDDVNHAISTELWGNTAGYPAIDRSGSVVGSGVVASRPVQPRLDPANRTVSWTVESGRVSVPESIREEDAVPVPTIREEHVSDEEEAPPAVAGHVRPSTTGWAKKQYLLVGHNDDDDDDDDSRMATHQIPGPEPENSHYRARP